MRGGGEQRGVGGTTLIVSLNKGNVFVSVPRVTCPTPTESLLEF